MPTDYTNRVRTHDAVVTPNTGDPTAAEVIQPTLRQANNAGSLVFNVKLHAAGNTADVQIWVYDSFLGQVKSEKLSFPPPGFVAPGQWAAKSDIAGQTPAITVPALSGTISITAFIADRKVGGN